MRTLNSHLETQMKLYQSNLSPYASRCRIQMYAKGIDDIELCEPPGGISSDEFKKVNPSGKIPALEVDGLVLGEAQIICEYLEDKYPEPSLRPDGDLERASARLLCQVTDLYILGPLFVMLPHMNPADRDQTVVDQQMALLTTNFVVLESYLSSAGYVGGDYAVGGQLSLADCAMVPALFVGVNVLPGFGMAEPLAATPTLARYWQAIQKDGSCSRVLAEMAEALKARMSGA
jgi:glutathione S-transferase